MLRIIAKTFLILTGMAIFAAYIWFGHSLRLKGEEQELCTAIQVSVLDSNEIHFIDSKSVTRLIRSIFSPEGKKISEIDIHRIESELEETGFILHSEISVKRNGYLTAQVSQREPVIRIETRTGGFYVDDHQYIFPLSPIFTSYVPIVSGNIPVNVPSGFKGHLDESSESRWIGKMLDIAQYISDNELWDAQVQQIEINSDGEMTMYMRTGDFPVIFGSMEGYEEKFRKLYTFYYGVVPEHGWNRYNAVNLKYRNQIVCDIRKIATENKETNQ